MSNTTIVSSNDNDMGLERHLGSWIHAGVDYEVIYGVAYPCTHHGYRVAFVPQQNLSTYPGFPYSQQSLGNPQWEGQCLASSVI